MVTNSIVAQPPTLSSFTPTSGGVGTLVTLIGANLQAPDSLTIGGIQAMVLSNTGEKLVAMVMPGTISGVVKIKNPQGTAISSSNFTLVVPTFPFFQQGNKLVGTGASGNSGQGYSVAMSADGSMVLVGGHFDNASEGAAWVFKRNGNTWSQLGEKLIGSGNAGPAQFGCAVALSADGSTAAVGGFDDNFSQGAVWIFVRDSNTWTQQGNKIVAIGNNGNAWFGNAISLSADGNTLLVGGINDSTSHGAAWVYTRNSGVWTRQGGKLRGTGSTGVSSQGCSVALSGDGNTAIVGGYGDNNFQGAAWIFKRSNGQWTQQGPKLTGTGNSGAARKGCAVSLDANGNTALVGGFRDNSSAGAAWVFTRIGTTWSQQGNKLVGSGAIGAANQGYAVTLSASGNLAMVGGYGENNLGGATWLFARNAGIWSQQGSKIIGSENLGSAWQGYSVAMSANGENAIFGGYLDSNLIGAAWVLSNTSNAKLSSLVFSTGLLSPLFDGSKLNYKLEVQNVDQTFSVTPFKSDSNASIQIRINGGPFSAISSGSSSEPLSLNLGNNQLEFKVTAPDGVTINTYTIQVVRPYPPTISSFSPANGSIGTLVTITGTYLNSLQTAISVGGVNAGIISISETSAVVMVMTGAVSGKIILTSNGGTAISNNNFTVLNSLIPKYQQGNKLVGNGSFPNAQQGNAVSISADGNTALIGGYLDNVSKGAAWVFTREMGVWSQQGLKLVGTNMSGSSQQGFSVSLSADGNTAVLGGSNDNGGQGASWIFIRKEGIWMQQGEKLVGTGNTGVAKQGYSVALSADGNTVLLGGFMDNSQKGAAWVFTRSNGIWTQQGNKLVGTGNVGSATMGCSVSLSADGNTALIGGGNDNGGMGAAWVFKRNAGVWTQQGNKLLGSGNIGNANQGVSVALSADGNTAILGGIKDNLGLGAAWIFRQIGGLWVSQAKLVGLGNKDKSNQGSTVSLSADGNTAFVGGNLDSSNQGAGWVFRYQDGNWNQQGNKIIGSGAVGMAKQGNSAKLSADGNHLIMGGPSDSNSLGTAWIFTPFSNAFLKGLILQTGSLTPAFSRTMFAYGTTVASTFSGIAITPVTDDSMAQILVRVNGGSYLLATSGIPTGQLALNIGNNLIQVKVIAPDGATEKIYSITVNRLTNVVDLSSLSSTSGNLNPPFEANTLSYSLAIPYQIASISITPTLADSSSNIQIKLNQDPFLPVLNGLPSMPLSLSIGPNVIWVKVTAKDQITSKSYTLLVNRATEVSSNAQLVNLTLSTGLLVPNFDSMETNYQVLVDHAVTYINITPTASNSGTNLHMRLNGGTYSFVVSGFPTPAIMLNPGNNIIDIKVTAEDGVTNKIYTITVFRAYPLGLPVRDSELSVKSYPNPTSGLFNLELCEPMVGATQIKVFDTLGRLVYEEETIEQNARINLSSLMEGNYLIRLTQNEKWGVISIAITSK